MARNSERSMVRIGHIAGASGVKGDLRISSYTEHPLDVCAYGPVEDKEGKEKFILKPKRMAKGHVIAHADGIDNRDAAERLRGTELFITREALPPPGEEEFYHNDLIDVAVFAVNGHVLGSVIAVHDFGAGTILEVARKAGKTVLVPFTKDVVPVVDLAAKRIEINPPEGLFGPIVQQTASEGCG